MNRPPFMTTIHVNALCGLACLVLAFAVAAGLLYAAMLLGSDNCAASAAVGPLVALMAIAVGAMGYIGRTFANTPSRSPLDQEGRPR